MKVKYLKGKTMEEWSITVRKNHSRAFLVWKYLIKAYPLLGDWVAWQVGIEVSFELGRILG
jgi:hypothetical protein